jgi:hypothetical protein
MALNFVIILGPGVSSVGAQACGTLGTREAEVMKWVVIVSGPDITSFFLAKAKRLKISE